MAIGLSDDQVPIPSNTFAPALQKVPVIGLSDDQVPVVHQTGGIASLIAGSTTPQSVPDPVAQNDPNAGVAKIFQGPIGRQVGLGIRAGGPAAAAAGLGAAVGAPFAGIGAIPGAVAGLGAYGLAKGVGDPVVRLYNGIAPSIGLGTMMPPTQTIEAAENKMGLPTPVSTGEKINAAMMDGVSGAASGVGLGQTISKSASPLISGLGKMLASNPALQAASGATSGVARESIQDAGGGAIPQVAGSVAAGAVPFVLAAAGGSPLNAANAATGGLLRSALAGKATPQEIQANIDAFKAVGATPTVGQATGSSVGQAADAALSRMPGGHGIYVDKAESLAEGVGNKINDMADALSPNADPVLAGQQIKQGISGTFLPQARQTEGQLWDNVAQTVPPNQTYPANRFSDALDQMTGGASSAPNLKAAVGGDNGAYLNQIKDAFTKDAVDGSLSFGSMKDIRTTIGQAIDSMSGQAGSSPQLGALKNLNRALTEDMQNAASTAGDGASQAFSRASTYSRSLNNRLDLTHIATSREVPESVYQATVGNTRNGATVLNAVMKSLPPEAKASVASSYLRRMGLANPGAQNAEGNQFSMSTFLTNWTKLSPQAKQALFNGSNPEMRQNLDTIANVAGSVRKGAGVFANPSGTAATHNLLAMVGEGAGVGTLALTGHLGEAAHLGAGLAATTGGTNLAARMMTNPNVVNWLANGSTQYPGGMLPAALNNMQQAANKSGDPDFKDIATQLQNQNSNPQSKGKNNSFPDPVNAQPTTKGGASKSFPPAPQSVAPVTQSIASPAKPQASTETPPTLPAATIAAAQEEVNPGTPVPKTTHYGYKDDPYMDDFTRGGQSASGIALRSGSVAITASMAKKMGLGKPDGSPIELVDANGNKRPGTYDDFAPEKDDRIDIYDPNGSQKKGAPFNAVSARKVNRQLASNN